MAGLIMSPRIIRGYLFFVVRGIAFANLKSAICAASVVLEGATYGHR